MYTFPYYPVDGRTDGQRISSFIDDNGHTVSNERHTFHNHIIATDRLIPALVEILNIRWRQERKIRIG